MKKIKIIACIFFVTVTFQYCSKNETNSTAETAAAIPFLPAVPFNYFTTYPAHIQNALQLNDNTPAGNAITNDGAALGRVGPSVDALWARFRQRSRDESAEYAVTFASGRAAGAWG